MRTYLPKSLLAAGTGAIILIGLALTISLTVTAAAGNLPEPVEGALAAGQEKVRRPADASSTAGDAQTVPTAGVQAGNTYSVSQSAPWTPPNPSYRISIPADFPSNLNRTDGIYRLDYAALSAAGLPVDTLDPRTFRMFYMGQEIAIRVDGEGDGQFNPADQVLFYARGVDSLYYEGLLPTNKYTGTNIFWLTYGGPLGRRMAQKDGAIGGASPGPYPRTVHLERYSRYVYLNTHPNLLDADHWFDVKLVAGGLNRNYTFQIANLAPSAGLTGSLKANLQGYNDTPAPHHIRIYLNGNLAYENNTSWYGGASFTPQGDVPQSYFVEGINTVSITLRLNPPTTYDEIYPNWVELTYYDTHVAENNSLLFDSVITGTWRYNVSGFTTADAEVFDVTEMLSVQQIVNTTSGGAFTVSFGDAITGRRRYLAATPATFKTPSSIQRVTRQTSAYTPAEPLSTTNRADYIIITHGDFFTNSLRLAAYRSHRYAVALLDVQDIYDRFNSGMMSAEAIRDFLAYAYTQWAPPAPRFVVLMGDGTSDMRNYANFSSTYIPPYLANVDPDLKETASDNQFVTITGNDNVPEIALGRFSVNTAAEAAAMVDKVIVYETQCQCGRGGDSWNKNTLFIADNLTHGGGDFYFYSDEIAEGYTDPPSNTIKLLPATYTVTKAYLDLTCIGRDDCRNQITQTLNITGALFVNYVGHAGKDYWSFDAVFSQDLLPALTMTMCLPVYLPMTCYEGSFHDPRRGFSAMAEAYTRMPTTGAVASWSPTGSGLVSGHDVLERGLFLAIFHQGYETLGEATVQAKQYHYNTTLQDRDLLDTMMIFGDPALRVKTESVCDVPTGLPVIQFRGAPAGGKVKLQWDTGSEADILAFNILRDRGDRATETRVVNPSLIVAAWAGSNQGQGYTFVDESAQTGEEYLYTLEVLKLSGGRVRYGPVTVQAGSGNSLYLPMIQR